VTSDGCRDAPASDGEPHAVVADERYLALIARAPVAIRMLDESGACMFVNQAWCDLTGLSVSDAAGAGWIAAIHPGDRARVSAAAGAGFAAGEALVLDYRICRGTDGRETSVRATRAVAGTPPRETVWAVVDITDLREAEHTARNDQLQTQATLDHVPAAIYVRDLAGRFQMVNAACEAGLGVPADEIIGHTMSGLLGADLLAWTFEQERPIRERGETVTYETDAPHADGTNHYYVATKYPVLDEDGAIMGIGGVTLDVTQRRLGELALAAREAEQGALRRVATAVAHAVDATTVFELVAREVSQLLGVEIGTVARFDSDDLGTFVGSWPPRAAAAFGDRIALRGGNSAIARVAHTGVAQRLEGYAPLSAGGPAGAEELGMSGGVAAPIMIAGRPWGAVGAASTGGGPLPADAELRIGRFAELTAAAIGNAAALELLNTQAGTDVVTGLANNRIFGERLIAEAERSRRHGRELSVVILDLDWFKSVNDTHGHAVGDRVLAEAARRLAAQTRHGELMARVGGEEFGWILPETGSANALMAAERARRAIEAEPFDGVGTVTVSAGVSSLEAGGDVEALMRMADGALYRAKASGRNATARHETEGLTVPDLTPPLSTAPAVASG
jgi:diguanylate cyclase (GGDEF)-like protein/PAS domain S-box-containing protein